MMKRDAWRNKWIPFLFALSFLLLLASGFIGCGSDSKSSNDPEFSQETKAAFKAAVDAALADATYKRGVSVAVYKRGYAMWTYAAGYADGDYGTATGTAMTPDTPTFAYSVTKTMVSALVLTQIHNGLYTLNDTVDGLLGRNADYLALSAEQQALINKAATVEQLLMHTSGMLDYAVNLPAEVLMCNPAYTTWKPADILEYFLYQDLDVPGTFNYSNTNYVLLGMIAEEKGGAPLNELLASTFFIKLGINAVLAPQDAYPPPGMAHPYDDAFIFYLFYNFNYSLGTLTDFSVAITLIDPSYNIYLGIGRSAWAAGGVIATAEDLARWGYELYDPHGVAVSTSVRDMLKNSAVADGDYGYGVEYLDFQYADGTMGGTYGHNGSALGMKTSLKYEKSKGITVAIITNVNNMVTGAGLMDQDALAHALFNGYRN